MYDFREIFGKYTSTDTSDDKILDEKCKVKSD